MATGGLPMRVALVGNPNVGKTTLFNALTGAHQEVANWPGTTVDCVTGRVPRQGTLEAIELVDLPGTYALKAYSQEERITEAFLLHEHPDAVIVVVDASRLERNLYLVLDTIAFTPRTVVALNMMDAAKRDGLGVDARRLSELLGVPVVPTVAARGAGLRALLAQVREAARRSRAAELAVPYPERLRREAVLPLAAQVAALGEGLGHPAAWVALELLQGDDELRRSVAALPGGREVVEAAHRSAARCALGAAGAADGDLRGGAAAEGIRGGGPEEEIALVVADSRYAFIAELLAASTRRKPWRRDGGDRLDALLLHPLLGYAIMACVFSAGFWLAFVASAPLSMQVSIALADLGRLAALQLSAWAAPDLLRSLILQGLFPGVGAVLAFVPYMAVFFTLYQFLQDTGYMARASLLVDRFMQLIGLHGKGFFALVSAYGCNVPAMAATRVMENPRDRLLANLVIPLIPCNARLGVMAVMTAAFFPGARGAVAMIGLVLLSGAALVGVTALYRSTWLPADPAPLVLELPRYHWPSWRGVLLATWHRVWLFLARIWWFLIWATIAIWALTHFPAGQPLDRTWAGAVGRTLEDLVGRHYGFDWRLMVAMLFGFVAKETTLSTLGVLFGATPGQLSLPHALAQAMTPLVAFTYLVVYMLYVPCLSTVVQMRRESGGWRFAALGAAVNVAVAFAAGLLVEKAGAFMHVRL